MYTKFEQLAHCFSRYSESHLGQSQILAGERVEPCLEAMTVVAVADLAAVEEAVVGVTAMIAEAAVTTTVEEVTMIGEEDIMIEEVEVDIMIVEEATMTEEGATIEVVEDIMIVEVIVEVEADTMIAEEVTIEVVDTMIPLAVILIRRDIRTTQVRVVLISLLIERKKIQK